MIQKSPLKYFLFAIALIAFDQAVKMAVHHFMAPGFAGQIKLVGDWFKLHYVLNPGMAFGMQLSHTYGKLILSVFRLFAMAGIGWYLVYLARRGAPDGLLWAMSMILAGAVGNVIDSTFYGVLLGNAPYDAPMPWFHGQVIDMIFIDVWEGFIPEWVPVWGGQYYSTPIFNIADACIFVGVCFILFFQRRYFGEHPAEEETQLPDDVMPDANEASVVPTPTDGFTDETPQQEAVAGEVSVIPAEESPADEPQTITINGAEQLTTGTDEQQPVAADENPAVAGEEQSEVIAPQAVADNTAFSEPEQKEEK